MTEPDWLAGKSADEMLEAVADRLSPRRWRLLGAAVARKLWDLLPPDPLREAVEFAELTDPVSPEAAAAWADRIAASADAAAEHARAATREAVQGLPPAVAADAPAAAFPSELLHRAAATYAESATRQAADAATFAADAVGRLFRLDGDLDSFDELLAAVKEADWFHTLARQAVANAHKLAAEGDAYADRYHPKTARIDMSRAEQVVRKLEEGAGDESDRQDKAYAKLLARALHELVGNPFRPVEFDPKWRTTAVVELARGIRAERAFDRMPALADALLDADCDAEAVLRHCRGTEKHATEKPAHLRGCWVLDLILDPTDPVFAAPLIEPPKPKLKPRGMW